MRLIALCVMSLLLLLPTMAQEDASAPSGEIAFASNRDEGVWQIYVMNADGSNVRWLTDGETDVFSPLWSPDGQKIAFLQSVESNTFSSEYYALWVMDADGSNAAQILGADVGGDVSTAPVIWSPDSERLLYRSYLSDEMRIEYTVVDADGAEQQALPPIDDVYQVHFLTNEALLFTVKNGENYQGLLYNLSDDSTTTLIDNGFALKPSPDDTLIPVMEGKRLTVFDPNTETSQVVRETLPGLLPGEVGKGISQLVWSDDGSRLAGILRVAVPDDPNSNIKPWRDLIFAVNDDGSEYVAVAIDGHEFHVSLSPAGEYMAFVSWDQGGENHIAIARADGTEPKMFITSDGENLQPAWRPIP